MLGVHRRAEIANFEVQVLARGVPGGAREPEYRLDGDRIGLQHAHLAEVCVKGAPAITAIDDHVVAVARGVTGRRDRASIESVSQLFDHSSLAVTRCTFDG